MTAQKKVVIGWDARLRYWRTRFFPIGIWLVALVVVAVLFTRQQSQQTNLSGIVEIRDTFVASTLDGIVVSLEVDLYQQVEQGDVIAMMDDQALRAELATARAELIQKRFELAAARQDLLWEEDELERDQVSDLRRLALDEDQARLDMLDREAALQVLRVEKEGLKVRLSHIDELLSSGFTDLDSQQVILYELKVTEARIHEEEIALVSAKKLYEEAALRREEGEKLAGKPARDLDSWMQPFEQALAAQEVLIDGLSEQRERLVLRAPISGRITFLPISAGQTVLAGEPIATVTSDVAERVIAYAPENLMETLELGAEVVIQTRRVPRKVLKTRVSAVGAKVEEMPLRLWLHPLMPQWGLPVMLEDLSAEGLYPGEVVDIRILSEGTEQ